jgi:hypothetical protein
MLKKEFRDTFRILLESSAVFLATPLVFGWIRLIELDFSFSEIAYWDAHIAIVLFAGYSGLGMFHRERKDKGFEYLLTLPYSKLRIFIYKVLPRVTMLVTAGLLMVIFTKVTTSAFLVPLLFFQLGMVFISLTFGSLFAGAVAGVILAYFHALSGSFIEYLFRFSLHIDPVLPSHFLAGLSILIPLGISFSLAFRNLDLKPFKYTVRSYLYIALPLLSAQAIIIFLNFEKFRHLF